MDEIMVNECHVNNMDENKGTSCNRKEMNNYL
jgi:hypothetical protein